MDRRNTRQVTEMRDTCRPVASSCLRSWRARDKNRDIRRKNIQCSGSVCRRVSTTLDVERQMIAEPVWPDPMTVGGTHIILVSDATKFGGPFHGRFIYRPSSQSDEAKRPWARSCCCI